MTQEIESEVLEMCNLSQGILERGIEQGLEKGIEQGIEKGIEQGIKQGLERGIEQGERNAQRKVVLNLARRGMLTADIAEAVMVSEQQVKEWLAGQTDE